jgi:hypothetical protein
MSTPTTKSELLDEGLGNENTPDWTKFITNTIEKLSERQSENDTAMPNPKTPQEEASFT